MNQIDFSYYELYIGEDLDFFGPISHVYRPHYLIELFCEEDRIGYNNENYDENYISYSCNSLVFLQRLKILGITDNKINEIAKYYKIEDILETFDLLLKEKLYNEDDIDAYLYKLNSYDNKYKNNTFLNDYRAFNDEKQYKFAFIDFRILLYLLIKNFKQQTNITIQFYSSQSNQKYSPLTEYHNIKKYIVQDSKTIILTEGKSDIDILQACLKLLYPGLSYLYSFFDFNTLHVEGSVNSIVNKLKILISAGFINRMIIIIDNDYAANCEYNKLKNILKNYSNYRIIKLPEIDIAKKYPVKDGNGNIVKEDINNRAVSIEFFTGKDIISNSKYYVSSVNSKQYSINDKGAIQQQFKNKIKSILDGKSVLQDYDWSEMKQLFNKIFNAFND